MPELSRFYGIVITMYSEADGNHSLPHIHVRYGNMRAVYSLQGELLRGKMPSKQHKLVLAWMALHELELQENWYLASSKCACYRIPPLKWDVDCRVLSVKATDSFSVVAQWSDGSFREYDVKPFLEDCGPYFARLNDPDYFKKVRVSEFGDTIEWPEGQDIAPESLYEDSLVLGVAG